MNSDTVFGKLLICLGAYGSYKLAMAGARKLEKHLDKKKSKYKPGMHEFYSARRSGAYNKDNVSDISFN